MCVRVFFYGCHIIKFCLKERLIFFFVLISG